MVSIVSTIMCVRSNQEDVVTITSINITLYEVCSYVDSKSIVIANVSETCDFCPLYYVGVYVCNMR